MNEYDYNQKAALIMIARPAFIIMRWPVVVSQLSWYTMDLVVFRCS